MKKTFLLVTLTLVLGLTGCGTSTSTDNSEVLAEIKSLREEIEQYKTNQPTTSVEQPIEAESAQEQAPAEQTVEAESAQEQAPAEQTVEAESAQEQAPAEEISEELQVFVIHKDKRIPVKLMEGKLTEACVSNPTDLGVSGDGSFRDLHFIFSGATISQVAWVNGNTFDYKKEAMVPQTINTLSSYLYFCMDEENDKGSANGIYSFEITTASGKIHSYSIQYYDDTIH